ncbi:hypothetical protein CVO77_07265 [Sphingopyxis lindanitolerans]|uniref:Uncharacterized protein n=1 Tax=Sphingopyxis lindanitolerans TaxID=2054227 RepID=A0A2S8B7I4_9SPHN|nr:hypothetical protein [Sphingopyxis lindanitolerans]PQM28290.1 hypothetical protein CVO77_07265 [Sphingopyxis lindanitolerans]
MTRLPLAALFLASSLAALPAAAQDAPVNADKVNQVIIYGDDKCEASSPDEIVVCNRLPEQDRYRVPQIFRGGDPLDPRNQAWLNRVTSMERVGRFGTDSCSPVGLGGFTGCTQALLAGAKAERQAADKTDWQTMIADERAKRIAGIDAASDEVEAAVVAEEKALAERQKAAEELERQASGLGPAPASAETEAEPDAAELPVPPKN